MRKNVPESVVLAPEVGLKVGRGLCTLTGKVGDKPFITGPENGGGCTQGRLNSIIGHGQNNALGPLPTQPLTGIKM